MPTDIRINENFDIELDHRNDLSLVTGREAFEQHLAVSVQSYYYDLIGTTNNESNLIAKIQLQAERIVDAAADIDAVASVTADISETDPNTVEVSIVYDTGEETTFEIN